MYGTVSCVVRTTVCCVVRARECAWYAILLCALSGIWRVSSVILYFAKLRAVRARVLARLFVPPSPSGRPLRRGP
eukprot:8722872-Pyramimonas_sp.AAC.1